ncbi:SMI1/KNR4 family protein [Pseudoalteromonas sp. SR45-6]|uniref:SMI1/KNR4 family protein n=1 Tax=Pseudoalteromonas sp. SR45-6 TaxID=2760927 RepID=UPI0016039811|nr:SMI1/KNR4 family protein [Pseudoalteromonas sp. SR45-6]MBB1342632.1 SMI1/KNR4 family protein [Pseudoalteromonas sp. SR45-6]
MQIEEVIALLKEKNEPVPKPLILPTEDEVSCAEKDLSFKFPAQYRKFMLEASCVTFGVREPGLVLPDLQPYCCLRRMTKDGRQSGVPKDFIVFCEENGNYFTINEKGNIGYYDHDDLTHNLHNGDFKDWVIENWLELE